jgi:hypothetical protein
VALQAAKCRFAPEHQANIGTEVAQQVAQSVDPSLGGKSGGKTNCFRSRLVRFLRLPRNKPIDVQTLKE